MIPRGRRFFKMSGSGNDFVFFDARKEPPGELADPQVVAKVCARGTGIGADGIVFLEPSRVGAVKMTYLNADGSRAMCGNASLCATRLSIELGAAPAMGFLLETDSGPIAVRQGSSDFPEIDLAPADQVSPRFDVPLVSGERRIGFADTGVPHLVIECDDVELVDVVGRGRPLRRHPQLAAGANVNFVSRTGDRWRMRTYERGVEAETLACGTGAVAIAVLLAEWGLAGNETVLETRSGRPLKVRLERHGSCWHPTLSGEARIVYAGELGEVAG
jgi:diaminopimelate epimerase